MNMNLVLKYKVKPNLILGLINISRCPSHICFEREGAEISDSLHRNLSKPRAEPVEPAANAD
jgi:hypothetical protein